ncbi:MAG: hypothetical protein ACRENL_11745 [Candidatus Dormibacteria bacterium]
MDLVAGPLRSARPAPIALFSPFYLAGWTDRERQFKTRRTIMFSNVVATRFMRATRPAAASSGILIDGQPPAILDATDVELKQAIGQWLSLHELMHGSGPAPFFAKWTGKSRLGKEYGVIEEMRVEMTSFVAAGLLDIHQGRIVQEMILMERLFRCARRGLGRRRRGEAVELDDAHGLAWLGALSDVAIRADSGKIRVDMAGVERTIGQVLATVYAIEQEAATADDAASVLSEHGRRLQSELLPGARSATRLVVAIAALDHPDAISLEGVEA